MISIKHRSAVCYSSYKKLDSKCDSETLVRSQQTADFATEKIKIRNFPVL
jgi:hypothetical protein